MKDLREQVKNAISGLRLEKLKKLYSENPEQVKQLLQIEDFSTCQWNYTALFWCIIPCFRRDEVSHLKSLEIMKWIYQNVDDPEKLLKDRTTSGATVLHWAGFLNHLEAAKWLCEKRPAMVFEKDMNGQVAMNYIINNWCVEVFGWMYSCYPNVMLIKDNAGRTVRECLIESYKNPFESKK